MGEILSFGSSSKFKTDLGGNMRIIIVGGIAAGMSAAAKLRRTDRDAEIVVYEKSPHISFGACGLPYYVGGNFDNVDRMLVRTPEKVRETGIDVKIEHEVVSLNVKTKTIEVKNLQSGEVFTDNYDRLMIATGAATVIPPIKNIEKAYTLRSVEDGEKLKAKMQDESIKKIAVIGAGFIGLEVADVAKELGKEVCVFNSGNRILENVLDKEVTEILEENLRAHGIELYFNSMVTSIDTLDGKTKVITNTDEVEVDLVVLAAGVRPNTSFLKDTGIEMLLNGAIVIDDEGKTSIQDIYAAGDCATVYHLVKEKQVYIPLATNANKLGRIVGSNLGGKNEKFQGTLGSSCIKLLDMEAGATGITEEDAKNMNLNYKSVFIADKNHTDYCPGQEKIYVKLIYNADTKVILGGQVVGKSDAVQRTNVLATAIFAKMTTEQLGMLDLCYAPPFARTWDALNIAGNVSK